MPTLYNQETGARREVSDFQARILLKSGLWDTAPPVFSPFTGSGTEVSGFPTDVRFEDANRQAGQLRDFNRLASSIGEYLTRVSSLDFSEVGGLAAVDRAFATGDTRFDLPGGGSVGFTDFDILDPDVDSFRAADRDEVVFVDGDGRQWTYGEFLAEGQRSGFWPILRVAPNEANPTGRVAFQNDLSASALRRMLGSATGATPGGFDIRLGSTGPGGGAGRLAPAYVKPDARLVQEAVKNYVVATTGRVYQDLIDKGVGTYMSEHRRGFDLRDSEQVDPLQSVKELVRADQRYITAQSLRPENVDETVWIPQKQQELLQRGVAAPRVEELGIQLATVGASGAALQSAAESQVFADSSRLLETQRNAIKTSAQATLGLI